MRVLSKNAPRSCHSLGVESVSDPPFVVMKRPAEIGGAALGRGLRASSIVANGQRKESDR
jgi:hypothetical protein